MRTLKVVIVILSVGYAAVFGQKTEINSENTKIVWTGKKIGRTHSGEIKLKSGFLELDSHKLTGGEIVIDMNTISNTDVKNEEYRQKLVGHLKSDDFFGVEEFPTASFEITETASFKGNKALLKGKLTIKGKTEPISFEVENKGNAYLATIEIDRSMFDVRYGSKSFFNNLGDNAINDIFTLDIELSL